MYPQHAKPCETVQMISEMCVREVHYAFLNVTDHRPQQNFRWMVDETRGKPECATY